MPLLDLTGQKFGRLTVINRGETHIKPSGSKVVMWNCLCDCGKSITMSSYGLRHNKRPSCGCAELDSKKIRYRKNDIGQKFGKLTITDIFWDTDPIKAKCICDCGNEYIGTKTDIVSGHTQSCGCLRKERVTEVNTKDWTNVISLYGVRFIKQQYTNKKGQWMWLCECGLCGNQFVALPAKVNNGHITSCGCANMSSRERLIQSVLDDNNIEYEPQYTFDDCKYKYKLRFDFGILINTKLLCLIEYDGEQHFRPVEYWGGQAGYEDLKKKDEIKNLYCATHNIPLYRLPYTLTDQQIIEQITNIIYPYRLQGDIGNNITEVVHSHGM